MLKRKVLLTFAPIYLLFFMGDALLSSYFALYFIENGLTSFQQSLLLSLIPFSIFAGCLVLSPLAKGAKRTLWLFRLCALIEGVLAFVFFFCHDFVPLLIVVILVCFFNGAPFAFVESLGSMAAEKNGLAYANIRMFGTLGYIVSLGFGAIVLRYMPFERVYFFSAALFLLSIPVTFFYKPKEEEKAADEVVEGKPKKEKANLKKVAILLLSLTLFYGAFNGAAYIIPIRLNGLGLSDSGYSLMRATGILAEFISLLLIPFLRKYIKDKRIPLMISAGLIILGTSFALFLQEAYALALTFLIITSIGKSFLFAYQAMLIEEKVGRTGLGIALTLANGLSYATAGTLNLVSSTIYTNLSFEWFFGLVVALEVAGFTLLFFVKKTGLEKAEAKIESKE
ncbi:MAG: MFS transporter [Bacilli bacterium]|nr:MFS transporter [Bacilli bacterium]